MAVPHFAARFLTVRRRQQRVATGMLATMAPGLPSAIAAQLAYPGRQVVAIVGDGGLAMLMAEMSTAAFNQLPIKILRCATTYSARCCSSNVKAATPSYGCDLGGIDFLQIAEACGLKGFRCVKRGKVTKAIQITLRAAGPALLEARVDPMEQPTMLDKLKV